MMYPEPTHMPIVKIPYLLHLSVIGVICCECLQAESDSGPIPEPDTLPGFEWNIRERVRIYQAIVPFLTDHGFQGRSPYAHPTNAN